MKIKNIVFLFLILATNLFAGDVIQVDLKSQSQADFLNSIDSKAIFNYNNKPILYIESSCLELLKDNFIAYDILKEDVSFQDIYILNSRNTESVPEIIYSDGDIHLIEKTNAGSLKINNIPLTSVGLRPKQLIYHESKATFEFFPTPGFDLDLETLISQVSQDSLSSYLHRLEAFTHRLAGTDSSYAARDWIQQKFISFGYDSVVIDPFIGYQLWGRDSADCYNVIATKVGTKYPNKQIIIGAHFDAVPDCPGADDNGTGTAAVLELARIFKDVETDMSMLFITFDSEESWMWGSYHYADSVKGIGDDIVLMINVDMIGHITNSHEANVYWGIHDGYAKLWRSLSDSLVSIYAHLGSSIASDNLPFTENGYDAIFVQERDFSTQYHKPSDSTTYINFEYMTRMTKGTAATAYIVNQLPPPINKLQVYHPGDGTSLILSWERVDNIELTGYQVYSFPTDNSTQVDSVFVSVSDTSYLFTGLTEGTEYSFYVQSTNLENIRSISSTIVSSTPSSIPYSPVSFTGLPILNGVDLTWISENYELDFSHYDIYRDGVKIASTTDTFYQDTDVTLGDVFHEYSIYAVDTDGNNSTSSESTSLITRAATLVPDRILAINRSNNSGNNFVNEVETGMFLREALEGYDYVYFSDTFYYNEHDTAKQMSLFSTLDYGNIVIGAEGGMYDDITMDGDIHLSETLRYYSTIGGNILIFGRFGSYSAREYSLNYTNPTILSHKFYKEKAGLTARNGHATEVINGTQFTSEMVGAKSQNISYPDLFWDSTLTQLHTVPFSSPYGIPFMAYAIFEDPNSIELLYTFDSSNDDPDYEDQPIAWIRQIGNSKIIMIDIPLSFMNRPQAITALQTAVFELLDSATDVDDNKMILPERITLYQNYPNPFNPSTTIKFSLSSKTEIVLEVFNILGQKVKTLADGEFSAGVQSFTWDGTNESNRKAASGIYLYRLKADDNLFTKKMLLLK